MFGVFRNVVRARPLSNAALTGFVVMSAGDAASQLLLKDSSSQLDLQRNLVASIYNGLASPAFYKWYRFMDWLIPGISFVRLVPKTLLSQVVTTGLNNPLFLAWCNHIETLLDSTQTDASLMSTAMLVDWAAVRTRTMEQLCIELPNLYGSSMLFWLPVTGINYALVPDHLKILWISSASVIWGGFVSHVAHREVHEGE